MSTDNDEKIRRNPAKLFASIVTEFNRLILEQKSNIKRDIVVFPATENDRFAQALFTNLAEGGFCTFVVTGRRDWDPRNQYYEAVRFAARRGCHIKRAFLLPHRHFQHDTTLQEHISLDKAAGIEIEVLYVGELIANLSLPLAESLEFGIWDNIIGCIGICGDTGLDSGVVEWRITSRAEDLQTLNDIKNLLHDQAEQLDLSKTNNSPDLEEPMIKTAPIAFEMAPVLCQGDHVSPEDCSWYHSIWQYLRIFNMVSTPTWHTKFYIDNLQIYATEKNDDTRILISGTADYSMLAHVLWAFNIAQKKALVTVLDLCETPLFLCKWYGKTVGIRIDTVGADILNYHPEKPFDIITTDAFLTRFPTEDRNSVIQKWHDMLSPKGLVITTARIERGLSHPSIQATPEQADAFRRRALQEARRWQGFLSCSPETIANLAQRYAERMVSYSFGSEKEVKDLFEANGFTVKSVKLANVPGEMVSSLYAEVVACRD